MGASLLVFIPRIIEIYRVIFVKFIARHYSHYIAQAIVFENCHLHAHVMNAKLASCSRNLNRYEIWQL